MKVICIKSEVGLTKKLRIYKAAKENGWYYVQDEIALSDFICKNKFRTWAIYNSREFFDYFVELKGD